LTGLGLEAGTGPARSHQLLRETLAARARSRLSAYATIGILKAIFRNFPIHFQDFPNCSGDNAFLNCTQERKRGEGTMDTVTVSVIFFLGAVAAMIILRVLFLVSRRSSAKDLDDQFLKRIANALQ
jgi:hypothetical protein